MSIGSYVKNPLGKHAESPYKKRVKKRKVVSKGIRKQTPQIEGHDEVTQEWDAFAFL